MRRNNRKYGIIGTKIKKNKKKWQDDKTTWMVDKHIVREAAGWREVGREMGRKAFNRKRKRRDRK